MAFLTIDVGGADLDVEVITDASPSWEQTTEGIDVSAAYDGTGLITKTYDPIDEWGFTALLFGGIDDLAALRAAAQYPIPISVTGDALRTSSSGSAPTVTGVTVKVGRAEYRPIGVDWFYVAPLTIRKVA